MSATAASVSAQLEEELAHLHDARVIEHIRSHLIRPELQMREWDYGAPGEAYPCWLIMAHEGSNTGIAYCEFGFGPSSPWGLLFLKGEYMSMGMDCGWYDRFLDTYFESQAVSELPIWRVFQGQGSGSPRIAITDEGAWDITWAEVLRLRSEHPENRYDCSQSVYIRDA